MQVAEPVSMAASELFIARQSFYNLGGNNISKAGSRWLSKANWKELETFYLRSNAII